LLVCGDVLCLVSFLYFKSCYFFSFPLWVTPFVCWCFGVPAPARFQRCLPQDARLVDAFFAFFAVPTAQPPISPCCLTVSLASWFCTYFLLDGVLGVPPLPPVVLFLQGIVEVRSTATSRSSLPSFGLPLSAAVLRFWLSPPTGLFVKSHDIFARFFLPLLAPRFGSKTPVFHRMTYPRYPPVHPPPEGPVTRFVGQNTPPADSPTGRCAPGRRIAPVTFIPPHRTYFCRLFFPRHVHSNFCVRPFFPHF